MARAVEGMYVGVVRSHPALFGRIYRAGELVSSPRRKSPVYYANALGRERMEAFLEAERPDVIACTHLFAAQTLTSMGARRARVTAAVMTDYTCAPFWEEVDMDVLYTPSPLLTAQFAAHGVDVSRAMPLGIPASPACVPCADVAGAKAAQGIGAQEAHIVLVGGSMGAGNLPQVARELLSLPARMTVVCGSNERVRARIEAGLCRRASPARVGAGAGRCTACWTARDVVVTKPGGLTSTEVMQKRLPLVFVSPIEGVETRNAAFLSGEGAALWAKAPGDAARMAGLLLQDARAREAQRAAQARLVSGTAAMDHRARPDRARKRTPGGGNAMTGRAVLFILLGYLSGGVMYAYHIPRLLTGGDVREQGADHNPGAANAFHLCGPTVGVLCALLDVLKATLPVYAAAVYGGLRGLPLAAAALAPVLGHA